jgi:hypothetical protein
MTPIVILVILLLRKLGILNIPEMPPILRLSFPFCTTTHPEYPRK